MKLDLRRLSPRSYPLWTVAAALGVALALTAGFAPSSAETASLKAILEVDRDAYYAGDPVPVRLSIWNDSGAPIDKD